MQEASLPPAVGQAMFSDMLSLLRDALDMALAHLSPTHTTPAPAAAPAPEAAAAADARRRLHQAGSGSTDGQASLFPTLPAGASADEADTFVTDGADEEIYEDYSYADAE